MSDDGKKEVKSPYELAVDRHEAATAALQALQEDTRARLSAAEREVGEALGELLRYEKAPGIPLPLDAQVRIRDLYVKARAKFQEAT